VYCAAPDNNVFENSKRNEINGSQLEAMIIENNSGAPKYEDNANISDSLRSLSTIHTSHRGHRGGTPRTPLTTRALHQHNAEQRHISQQQHIIAMEPIKISDGEIYVLYGDSTGDRNGCLVEASFYTQHQKRGRKKMSNKADRSVTDQEATGNLVSHFVVEVDEIDRLGEVIDDMHLSCWDTGTADELNAWGNDLAGVGEHLADYTYQEYASHGKLVVDQ
jgi:hypothetical protein